MSENFILHRIGKAPLLAMPRGAGFRLSLQFAEGYDPGLVEEWSVLIAGIHGSEAPSWRGASSVVVEGQVVTIEADSAAPSDDDAAVTLADVEASGRCSFAITATPPTGAKWRIQGVVNFIDEGSSVVPPQSSGGSSFPVTVSEALTIPVTILGTSPLEDGGEVTAEAVNAALAESPALSRAALALGDAALEDASAFEAAGAAAALASTLGDAATLDVGTTPGTVAAGDHAHAQLHDALTVADSTSISLTLVGQQLNASANFGTTSGTICQGDDSRLSDPRNPAAHKTAHATGGADAIAPADIGAATAAQGAKADSALQSIPLSGVGNSHLANMASGTIKGQTVGGSGNPVDLTPAQQKGIVEAALASGGSIAIRATGTNNNVVIEPNGNGAAQVKGNGAGMAAYALLEFVDGNGSRIGMVYNEPTSGKMVFMNSRAGTLAFGSSGADRFTVYTSGGLHIGDTATDPGANALRVQGSITSNSGGFFCRGSTTNGFELFNGSTRIGFFSNVFGAPRLTIGGDIWLAPSGSDSSDVRLGRFGANGVHITDAAGTTRRDLRARSVELNGALTLGALTVGTLPTASTNAAARYEVTDASAPSVGASVVSGGSSRVTVRSNGTNWIVTELH